MSVLAKNALSSLARNPTVLVDFIATFTRKFWFSVKVTVCSGARCYAARPFPATAILAAFYEGGFYY